jgi:hypothetical protein
LCCRREREQGCEAEKCLWEDHFRWSDKRRRWF